MRCTVPSTILLLRLLWAQSEGGTDIPPGTTAQVWHQGGCRSSSPLTRMYAGNLDDNHWIVKLDFKNTSNSVQGCCWPCELALALYTFVYSILFLTLLTALTWQHTSSVCRGSTTGRSAGSPPSLPVHTSCWPLLPVEVRVQCMVPAWQLCARHTGGHLTWPRDYTGCGGWIWACIWTVISLRRSALTLQQLVTFCAQVFDPESATLLGSPIWDVASVMLVINDKIRHLTTMGDRLQHLSTQYKPYPNAAIMLRDCTYTCLVSLSQPHSLEWWNVILRRTCAAPRS